MSSGPTVLRQAGVSRIAPIAVWVFCVVAGADAIIEGTAEFALRTVLALSTVALATWIVLASPHLAADAEGVTIVNPARVVRVPFGALVALRVGGLVTVVARFAGGRERTITSWNAPGVQRRRPTPRLSSRGDLGVTGVTSHSRGRSDPHASAESHLALAPPQVAVAVDRFRVPWERDHPEGDVGAAATTTWRWREWLVLLVLVVVNVAIRLR